VHESDWFTAIATAGGLGVGLYMSTYRKAVLRGSGLALMALALVGGIFWFGYYRNAEAQSPSSGNCNNFIGGNNSGTINTNCPTFNQGPAPPTIRALGMQPPQKGADNNFTFTWFLEIISAVPAKALTCVAMADGNVFDVGFSSQFGTQFSSGKNNDGNFYALLQNASGKYSVDVKAKAETPTPNVKCQVE